MQKLLIATHNPGKVREYRALLADLPLQVVSLADEGITHDVEETGSTFAENAILKAREYVSLTGLWTWADDSGLEVDLLGGQPGVYSARYGGPGLDDAQRIERLLTALGESDEPPARWTARFRCVVALALPNGRVLTAEDSVEGLIITQARGEHGFGYDPVFYMPKFKATMAELDPEVKNRVSHRAKASQTAKTLLHQLLAENGEPPANGNGR